MGCLLALLVALLQQGDAPHAHGDTPHQHDAPASGERFVTDRDSPVVLELPLEDDAFSFVIFGDRTGGPAAGVQVLAEAVDEVNVLGPDLVMTVGDLIEGYNQRPAWQAQADEFLGIMNGLEMPWFPVAGNHDVYWRGPNRPDDEHEGDYELTFGPLWYAFEHKDCWFVVLYSDEPDPQTGERNFRKPASQVMSPRQFTWLEQTLARTSNARHVFVFLHHPRWMGGQYGDDWERVHRLLASRGNVRAVFAGHIHQMKYSGVRDGIEYFTLATVGGHQSGVVPEAGFLHQYHLVTVRDEKLAIASLPVGSVDDPRLITEEVSTTCRMLANELTVRFDETLRLDDDWGLTQAILPRVHNPSDRPIEVTLSMASSDPRWSATPDHDHARIEPGETWETTVTLHRFAETLDGALTLPALRLKADYLGEGIRVPLPDRDVRLRVQPPTLPAWNAGPRGERGMLSFDGVDDHIEVASEALDLPDGPFTVEFWMRADRYARRQGVVNKTENSEWGFFLNEGAPAFMVFLEGNGYVEARGPAGMLKPGQAYRLAGVYDGQEVRLYVDGERVAATPGSGKRRINNLPLLIGADVDGRGRGTSWFDGHLMDLMITADARYQGERVNVPSHQELLFAARNDERVRLFLPGHGLHGPWVMDESRRALHPQHFGGVQMIRWSRD